MEKWGGSDLRAELPLPRPAPPRLPPQAHDVEKLASLPTLEEMQSRLVSAMLPGAVNLHGSHIPAAQLLFTTHSLVLARPLRCSGERYHAHGAVALPDERWLHATLVSISLVTSYTHLSCESLAGSALQIPPIAPYLVMTLQAHVDALGGGSKEGQP